MLVTLRAVIGWNLSLGTGNRYAQHSVQRRKVQSVPRKRTACFSVTVTENPNWSKVIYRFLPLLFAASQTDRKPFIPFHTRCTRTVHPLWLIKCKPGGPACGGRSQVPTSIRARCARARVRCCCYVTYCIYIDVGAREASNGAGYWL